MSAASTTLTSTIGALEDETWKSLTRSGKELLPHLTEDCIMQLPFGMSISETTTPSIREVMSSEAFIPWRTYAISHVMVTPVGNDGAVISYRVRASRPDVEGNDERFRALICSVWRKDAMTEDWKMCFHQQTPFNHEEDLEQLVHD